MRTRHGGGAPELGAIDPRHSGPTVARMLVGAQLRTLREAAGISRAEAGYAIRGSHSKISRLELGRTGFKRRDVADLLTLYGVTDDTLRDTLIALTERANAPGWWHEYADVLPGWFDAYLGLEQAASIIRTFAVQFLPALLQTEEYARAAIRTCHRAAPETELERRVGLRMRRRELLHRPDPPNLWAVIDEAALRRSPVGAAAMRRQIEHLVELIRLPRITVQILPFSAGSHPAGGGPVTMLRFPQGDLPDVVYLEQLAGALYLDKPAEVAPYRQAVNMLGVQAEQPSRTPEILHRLLDDLAGV